VGVDKAVPLWDEAVEVLASGVVKVTKLISFTAGFDRTCVVSVSGDGRRQVIEVQLWTAGSRAPVMGRLVGEREGTR
jgi:hypothetical protein